MAETKKDAKRANLYRGLYSMTSRDDLLKRLLLSTTASLALIAMAPQAMAQDAGTTDAAEEEVDEVVATGIRQALKAARDIKRDADTAVDSITASDVSTLPDLSVAEALARVPGVVVQRINLGNDGGDFPSPEGGGNLIRGLTLVRSELNGRDGFSANGGRSLDFGTIPPELIGAVDVYKNTSADLIEGGIGGTINLRTLEPFDRPGQTGVLTLDATYTDLRKEVSPDISALYGNRWDTDAGEFGLLGSFSRSELKSDLNGFQIGQIVPFAANGGTIALPGGFQARTNEVDRSRDSYYLAGQWQNPDQTLRVTGKYALIRNEVDTNERTLEWFPDGESWNQFELSDATFAPFTSEGLAQCNGSNDPTPANPTCEQTQVIDAGIYESGIISNNLRDWTGAAGAPFTNLGINQVTTAETDDLSLNIKWRPTDQLFINLDGHVTTAEATLERLWVGSRFFSDFNFNADLDDPQVTLIRNPASNPFVRAGGATTGGGELNAPSNAYLLFAADQFEDNEGDMFAIRGDVEYEFDNDGWFDSVQFGARIAEREQINRQAGLNWASVAPPWSGGYLPYSGLENVRFEAVDFADFFRGGVFQGDNTQVIFPDRILIRNYDAFVNSLNADPSTASRDWNPLRSNGVVDYGRGTVGEVTESTQNFYARLNFGNEFDNGMSVDANIGVRYSNTDTEGVGERGFISLLGNDADNNARLQAFIPEAVAYSEQAPISQSGTFNSDDRWLPSLNVKWNLNDEMLIRLAASQAITRPNIAQLRSTQTAVVANRFVFDEDEVVMPGATREPLDIVTTQINVFGGNPNLKPILSDNYDLSFEYYFGDENSFTASLFRKDITNNIIFGSATQEVLTLDGNQVPVVFNGDLNQDEANIQGFELAYQQFYDFLPGLLGNLGLQANYTYIDAETNAPLPVVDADGDGTPDSFERIFRYGVNNFLGLSEHAANVIGIYQSNEVEIRLAYNWRSEYLSDYRDFVTGNPIFQTDRGYLDGSFKWDINDSLQFRAQVANILDTKANAEQQIDASGQRFGRTSFVGDRRIRVGLRYAF